MKEPNWSEVNEEVLWIDKHISEIKSEEKKKKYIS
jgi:hypothetical protein